MSVKKFFDVERWSLKKKFDHDLSSSLRRKWEGAKDFHWIIFDFFSHVKLLSALECSKSKSNKHTSHKKQTEMISKRDSMTKHQKFFPSHEFLTFEGASRRNFFDLSNWMKFLWFFNSIWSWEVSGKIFSCCIIFEHQKLQNLCAKFLFIYPSNVLQTSIQHKKILHLE